MRLNLEKCIFSVQGGKFLGFMLTHRGIEANLKKCVTIIEMRSPNTWKEFQRLTCQLATLSIFSMRAYDMARPFFKLLTKKEWVEWNEECEANFLKLK